MTLKLTRYFTDALKKQAAISHFMNPVKLDTPDNISSEWKRKLLEQFGELFLNDANYIVVSRILDSIKDEDAELEDIDDNAENQEAENTEKEEKANDNKEISKKTINQFTDLLANVFTTDIPKSDVKQIEDYLFVKITTK